jgi:hypothetical protein
MDDTTQLNDSEEGDASVKNAAVHEVHGESVTMEQAVATSVNASELVMRQSAAAQVSAETLNATSSALAYTQATTANLNAGSNAVVAIAGADVTMDMSATRVLVAGGKVDARSSALGVVVADSASVHESNVFILIAKNVDGNVKPQLDTRGAIVAGAVAGAVLSTIVVALSFLRPRKKK